MVLVFEGTKNQYSMDGYLHQNLQIAKNVIKKDWDMIIAVDGPEGCGKSVFTMQAAYFCDPSLCISRIVFTPEEFRKAVLNAQKFEAVVYDEAYTGLNSRAAMSMINRALVQMLAEIRQKNLFIFVVMPCFFDLDKYVALWRSRALVHAYTGDNFERGYFAFYNSDRKKELFINGKKFYSYTTPRPNFSGRFPNHYVIDESEYRRKKSLSLKAREQKSIEDAQTRELEDAIFSRVMDLGEEIPHDVKQKILSMPRSTYFWRLRQYHERKEAGQLD